MALDDTTKLPPLEMNTVPPPVDEFDETFVEILLAIVVEFVTLSAVVPVSATLMMPSAPPVLFAFN